MTDALNTEEHAAYAFVRDARQARLRAERMRKMAADRALQLESRLRQAAEADLQGKIFRNIDLHRRLQALRARTARTQVLRRAAVASLAAVAVLTALVLNVADVPLWQAQASPAPTLQTAPGDSLKLSLTYTLSR